MQACDDFLDELLSHEVAGDGRVPDIRYYLDSQQEATPDMGRSHNIGWQHSKGFFFRFLSRMGLQMSLEIALLDSDHVRNCKEVDGYLNGYLKALQFVSQAHWERKAHLCQHVRLHGQGRFLCSMLFCGNYNFQRILNLIYNPGGATGRGRLESVHKGPREKGQPQHE